MPFTNSRNYYLGHVIRITKPIITHNHAKELGFIFCTLTVNSTTYLTKFGYGYAKHPTAYISTTSAW